MKVIVIGATGNIGHVVATTLQARGHDVISASRSGYPAVDISDPDSIAAFFEQVGKNADAVVVTAGAVPFKPFTELTRDDYLTALTSKTLSQVDVASQALKYLNDGGSITLTSGVIARAPIATAAAAALAAESPRGIRINAVSPDVLENSPQFHATFAGHRPVSDEEIGRAYTLAVEGVGTGQTITV
ncbi:MAG: short chain dehydrogenase [Ancrocorticia sp.]|nr:short chain dehydrogenase [Ancrocorticia sp.]